MKSILKLIAALAMRLALLVLAVVPASAQTSSSYSYPVYTLTLVSNTVAAASTLTCTNVIPLTKYDEVALQFTGVMNTNLSGVGTITLTFQQSLDKSNWFTFATWAFQSNAQTPVTVTTNINVGAIGYVKLLSIANACTNACDLGVTSLKWAPKAKRYGDQ